MTSTYRLYAKSREIKWLPGLDGSLLSVNVSDLVFPVSDKDIHIASLSVVMSHIRRRLEDRAFHT
jgi:hypothetical protein